MAGRAIVGWSVLVPLCGVIVASAGSAHQSQPSPEATARLATVREAMGGEARLAAISGVRIKGHARGIRNNLVERRVYAAEPTAVEYRMAFPDRFLYIHAGPLQGRPPLRGGFTGRQSLIAGMDVRGGQQMMGHLLFALLLISTTAFPVTLTGVEGDTLVFQDRDRSRIFIDLEPGTNLPRRMRFTARDFQQGGKRERIQEIKDFRRVGDLLLPHQLINADAAIRGLGVGLYFDSFEINPTFTDADFVR